MSPRNGIPFAEAIHAIQAPKGPCLSVMDLPSACLAHGSYDVVISLLDPGTALDWQHPRHHTFWVDDVEFGRRSTPDMAFVEALLSVDLAGATTVLTHCHGGFSRSPAAAMLWASKLGTSPRTIERGIDWDQADPNRLILALGEAHLGLERPLLREMAYRRTGRREPMSMLLSK